MSVLREQLDSLLYSADALVAAYDNFDRLRFANPAFRTAFFIEAEEEPVWADLMRRNFAHKRGTVIVSSDIEDWLKSTLSRRGKIGLRSFETSLHDGRWLWMTETVQANGWMLCIAVDVSALHKSARSIRQDRDAALKAAYTDELTGVSNRRFVTARIHDMLHEVQTSSGSQAGCVCVLDLDNFKYVNDRYGHDVGDTVLKDFSDRIQRLVRRSDCFGRVGGEEFVLVLPRTGLQEAELILDRMLANVRTSRPLPSRPDLAYTFSAGITLARVSDTVEEIFGRADQSLYSAKLAGRNRIHSHAA